MAVQKSDNSSGKPMSAITPLQRAKSMAVFIDDTAYAQYGDREVARKALARQYGWAENAIRCLRYDRAKTVKIDLYSKLCEALEDAAERQIRKLENDISEARSGRQSLSSDYMGEAQEAIDRARTLLSGGAK